MRKILIYEIINDLKKRLYPFIMEYIQKILLHLRQLSDIFNSYAYFADNKNYA